MTGNPCTFCGAPAVASEGVAGNVAQMVHTCRARACRDEFARLTSADHYRYLAGSKKRTRRRRRQRTHLIEKGT